jgi:Amt family ammonium transporter
MQIKLESGQVALFKRLSSVIALIFVCASIPFASIAQDAAATAPTMNGADTAWMMVSSLLVLMMTIPGLALFYGGMVQRGSVLAVLAQSFGICCFISILWVAFGYSLAFTEGTPFIGNTSRFFLNGMDMKTLSGTIPESVFVFFQMTFAIITAALIMGAVATRIKFSSMLVFAGLFMTLIYAPICHWVWGPAGLLSSINAPDNKGLFGFGVPLDFAGGTVVHINAGIAGLVAALLIRKGHDFDKRRKNTPPYNIAFSLIGASLLWVGWFGFNAGSAVASGERAGMAMLVTHIATASAAMGWMVVEWLTVKKPTVLGMISGAVAGLVAITPASGFVGVGGALAIGFAAGIVCFYGSQLKYKFGYDDTLDVFGIHCVGGILGAILTGVFAVSSVGGVGGLLETGDINQLLAQIEGVVVTLVYSGVMSFILLKLIDAIMGLRVDENTEMQGLDMGMHGEKIHH